MFKLIAAVILMTASVASAAVVKVTSEADYKAIVNQAKPVIIMFGASWCPACVEAKPAFVEAEKLYKGKVIFAYFDVDTVQVGGIPYIPSYVTTYITGDFNQDSLNKLQSRDVQGLIKYIEEQHNIRP